MKDEGLRSHQLSVISYHQPPPIPQSPPLAKRRVGSPPIPSTSDLLGGDLIYLGIEPKTDRLCCEVSFPPLTSDPSISQSPFPNYHSLTPYLPYISALLNYSFQETLINRAYVSRSLDYNVCHYFFYALSLHWMEIASKRQ